MFRNSVTILASSSTTSQGLMAGLANMDFETKESSVGVREGADLGEEDVVRRVTGK